MDGFVEGGAIDEKTHEWPDFNKIIGTCNRVVKAEEVELIVNNFQLLYDYFVKHGRISEELYDQIGLQEDYNSSGDIKLRRSNDDCH